MIRVLCSTCKKDLACREISEEEDGRILLEVYSCLAGCEISDKTPMSVKCSTHYTFLEPLAYELDSGPGDDGDIRLKVEPCKRCATPTADLWKQRRGLDRMIGEIEGLPNIDGGREWQFGAEDYHGDFDCVNIPDDLAGFVISVLTVELKRQSKVISIELKSRGES